MSPRSMFFSLGGPLRPHVIDRREPRQSAWAGRGLRASGAAGVPRRPWERQQKGKGNNPPGVIILFKKG